MPVQGFLRSPLLAGTLFSHALSFASAQCCCCLREMQNYPKVMQWDFASTWMLLLHMASQSRSICANFPAHLANEHAASTLVSRSRVQPLLLLPVELSTTGCHSTPPHLLLLVLRLPEHPVQIFLVTRRAVLRLELFTTDFA